MEPTAASESLANAPKNFEPEDLDAPEAEAADQPGLPMKKSKRKGKGTKSATRRGDGSLSASRGTGFEDFYADPPITPQESKYEHEDVYSPERPFEERMQNCIQRFRSRRRLNSTLNYYFNEYLFLGGVDTSPSPFSGQDPRALKDQGLTPAEIREAAATDTIHTNNMTAGDKFYSGDREHWSVDFTGVVSGFLSLPLCTITGLEKESLNLCVSLVENFLRYVLMHDVCPEYGSDVYSALDVCAKAREEWPTIQKLEAALPGQFNLACAMHWHTLSNDDWVPFGGFKDPAHAEAALAASLASLDPSEHIHAAYRSVDKVPTREFDCGFEVQEVHQVSEEIVSQYKRLKFGSNSHVVPVGTVRLSKTTIEDGWQHPATDTTAPDEVSLHLENSILQHIAPGLKLELTLVEVGVGAYYIKTLRQALPSFYKFLPQQLMRVWKPLRKHDRPAPSVHDHADGETKT